MTIEIKKYLLATKEFPLMFEGDNDECDFVSNIEDAYFYNNKKQTNEELTRYDFPEKYQVLPVKITYEF